MLQKFNNFRRGAARKVARLSSRAKGAATVGAVMLFASPALATTPTLDSVTFPIDTASIATAVAAAGATILIAAFAVAIGFVLVKKLKGMLVRSV